MVGKIFRFALCCSLAWLGYQTGLSTTAAPEQADFSSTEPAGNGRALGKFSDLKCPSESQFLSIAREINLEVPAGPSLDEVCDESQRASLGKVLLLMTELKFDLPQNWPEPLKSDLLNSLHFLKKNTNKLALDLDQKDSIAYNRIAQKEIYLGGRFFSFTPLDAVSVLIHEARHSVSEAPGHEFCLSGDLPRSSGACDAEFSLKNETAGAYSYGTIFYLSMALYAQNISEADRKHMLVSGLVQMGARFNKIPDALARKVDVLAVLNEKGEVHIVHPYLHYTKPLALQFDEPSERSVRIEFSPVHNGLFIFTNKGRVWSWSAMQGLEKLYPHLLTPDKSVANLARVRVPFRDHTLYNFQFSDGSMKFADYSPQINERVLVDYPMDFPRASPEIPDVASMSLGLLNDTIFLDKKGELFLAPHYGTEFSFNKVQTLQSSQGWSFANGGVIYDTLLLIDKRGDLHRAALELVEISDESSEMTDRKYSVSPSDLELPSPIRKINEGLKVQAATTQDNRLLIWKYGTKKPHLLEIGMPVVDFVLMQNVDTQEPVGRTAKSSENFKKVCKITRALRDPWMGRGIGYDGSGQVVMAGPRENDCVQMKLDDLKKRTPYFD